MILNNLIAAQQGSKVVLTPIANGATNTSTTSAVPTMTSNTAPSGVASASPDYGGGNAAWAAFDASDNTFWYAVTTIPGWVQYEFPSAIPVNKYTMVCYDLNNYNVAWTMKGSNDGTNWTTLQSLTGQFFAGSDPDVRTEEQTFTFSNATSYKYYRLTVTQCGGLGSELAVPSLKLIECQYQ